MNKKLLSICIPTFNRCETLDDTLNRLFSNPDFDEKRIEVIVSDNFSTDNTAEIIAKYPLAIYCRNEENIRDRNFSKVLEFSTGSYIRLFNDTLSFKEGALKIMLDRIEKHSSEDCNLFFYENIAFKKDCQLIIKSRKEFVNTVSLACTWIANFGTWSDFFIKINNKDRYVDLQFVQVDWSYRIVENNKPTIIYFDNLFDVAMPNKKGGYNIFEVFINNYLLIIKNEKMSFFTYEKQKYYLCRYFIYGWYVKLMKDKTSYDFDTKKFYKILFNKYWYEPYLYPMLFLIFYKKIIFVFFTLKTPKT